MNRVISIKSSLFLLSLGLLISRSVKAARRTRASFERSSCCTCDFDSAPCLTMLVSPRKPSAFRQSEDRVVTCNAGTAIDKPVGSAGCLRSLSLDDESDHGFVFLTADPSFRQLEIGDRFLALEPVSHGRCTA